MLHTTIENKNRDLENEIEEIKRERIGFRRDLEGKIQKLEKEIREVIVS